jgi:hypothetical protein
MNLLDVGWGVMDWIDLAQNRDRWWALVNALLNLRIQDTDLSSPIGI